MRSGSANAVISVLGLSSQQVASFVITLTAAGFLSAADYGVYTIAIIFVEFVVMFTYTGIFHYIVTSDAEEDQVLSTMFWIMLAIGVVGGAGMFAGAGAVARILDAPALAEVLRWFGLMQPFASVIGWASAVLLRHGLMRRYYIVLIIGNLGGLAAGVVVLWLWQSLYALIVYRALRTAIELVLFTLAAPRWPRLIFNRVLGKDSLSYSAGLYGSNVMTFFANFGTDLVLAYLMSTAEAGLYRFANRLAMGTVDIVGQPLRSFSLKTFGAAARSGAPFERPFAVHFSANLFLMGGFAASIAILGTAMVEAFFRPEYYAAIGAMYAFALRAAARAGSDLIDPVFAARKRTRMTMYFNIGLISAMISTLLLADYGFVTLAWAQALVQVGASLAALLVIRRWGRINLSDGLSRATRGVMLLAGFGGSLLAICLTLYSFDLSASHVLYAGFAAALVLAVPTLYLAVKLRVLDMKIFMDGASV